MRKRTRQIPVISVAISSSVLLAVAVTGYFLFARGDDPFRNLEKLDVVSYSESAKSFQGGIYLVEGTLREELPAPPGKGKLVALDVSSPQGVVPVPVLIPELLQGFNLQKGQVLKMKVKGVERGLLRAEKLEKAQ